MRVEQVALAERKLLIVVAGMEEVPDDREERERMDSYVLTGSPAAPKQQLRGHGQCSVRF